MDDKCTWCGSPDHSERLCRFGEHGEAEAVIRHIAVVDHDYESPAPLLSFDGVRHWLTIRVNDGPLAEAVGRLGATLAAEIYLDERRRLR